MTLDVYRFLYEPVDSNMYFIPFEDTGIVFDPNEDDELPQLFEQFGTKRVEIILTHEHYDHITGVEWLQGLIEAPVFCQEACGQALATNKGNSPRLVALVQRSKDAEDGGHRYEDFMAHVKTFHIKADKTFSEQTTLSIGDIELDCYSTPGHSPGSACYILDGRYVFTGDSLIQNTPTITRFKTSNRDEFENITRPFLRSLGKNMLVFPGHGEPFKISESKFL